MNVGAAALDQEKLARERCFPSAVGAGDGDCPGFRMCGHVAHGTSFAAQPPRGNSASTGGVGIEMEHLSTLRPRS